MKKYFKYILMALVAVIFIGTFVFLYIKSQPQPEVYDEFTLQRMDIRKTTVVTGKIEPRNEVNVKPQISGIITEILKEAGETVQEGEVIAKVKVIPDMGSLSAAQSRLRLAEINRKQAQTDYDREKTLFDKGLVAADEYDKIAQALRQAREEVDAAQDNLPSNATNIRSGYSANAEIVLAEAKNVLAVQESAIEFDGDDTYVYVIKGEGDKQTYERRKVQTGISDGINIEIRSGVKPNERIRGPKMIATEKAEPMAKHGKH